MMSAENIHIVQGAFEQLVELDEWDAPPLLVMLIDGGEQGHGLAAVPIHEHHWDGDPRATLRTMAELWEAEGFDLDPIPDGFVITGVGFIHEAWALRNEVYDRGTPDILDAAENRTIHAHPDRVEVRLFNTVDLDGNIAIATNERGEKSATMNTDLGREIPGSDRLEVVELLHRIAATVKAASSE